MSWSLNMDILQQLNDRGLHFFFETQISAQENSDCRTHPDLAEGSCEEFDSRLLPKKLLFFFFRMDGVITPVKPIYNSIILGRVIYRERSHIPLKKSQFSVDDFPKFPVWWDMYPFPGGYTLED